MFADPRTYPPKACERCGTVMACGTTPNEMSNWSRKRFCSRECRDKTYKEQNPERNTHRRKALSRERARAKAALPPVTGPEKVRKTLVVEPWESRLNFTVAGATRSLRATLIDTLKLHPELGVILADPNTTYGMLDMPPPSRKIV